MKIYMDPKETAIINLEEVKQIAKYGVKSLSIEFKDGSLKSIDYMNEKQRDDELRLIFHEMHD